jgi:hypothetical protein
MVLVAGEAVFVAGAAGVVWWAWHAEFVGPVGGVLSTIWLGLLIGLPWVVRSRRVFGAVAASMAAILVRFGSYAVLCALIPVIVWLVHYGNARHAGEPSHALDPGELATDFFLVLLIGGYAVVILALTSQRWATPSRTLAFGGGFGVLIGLAGYGLTPFGGALHLASGWLAAPYVLAFPVVALGLPALAGILAANDIAEQEAQARQDGPSDAQVRQGVLAGLVAGIVAALMITVFTITTILLFPHRVSLEYDGPGPPPNTPANREMSVADTAGGYQIVLLLGPGITALAGMAGVYFPRRPGGRRRPAATAIPRTHAPR